MGHFDNLVSKAKLLKAKYDSDRHDAKAAALNHLEITLDGREAAVREKEKRLGVLERDLVAKSARLERQRKRPLLVFIACVLVGVLGFSFLAVTYTFVPRASAASLRLPVLSEPSSAASAPAPNGSDDRSSVSTDPLIEEPQPKYGGGEEVDVAQLCRDAEAKGGPPSEQCVSTAPLVLHGQGSVPGETAASVQERFVHGDNVNCRSGPSPALPSVQRLARNTRVAVSQEQNGWSLIGREPACWVSSGLLGENFQPPPAPERRSSPSRSRAIRGGACPCGGTSVCTGPRGGRYCITSGGHKSYGD